MKIKVNNYRADIDGLRAIAVLLVVFYHANISFFSGGYVGVDVFFVISGYLITNIIRREGFSFSHFYTRRIKRIFPALFLVLLFSSCVALVVLTPEELQFYGANLLATTIFSSNIFLFFNSGDYFDSNLNPLLHMWSLGVEEQFYIFWPIMLILILKSRLSAFYVILFASLSFLLSIDYDEHSRFYLTYLRGWELLAGAILTWLPSQLFLKTPFLKKIVPIIGLAMIFYAAIMYDSYTSFPGWTALLPVIGAMCVLSGRAFILEWKPMVSVGLISYSLYLWHWPVLIFTEKWLLRPLTMAEGLLCILFSMVMAYLSWRYVETPFRKSKKTILFPVVISLSCSFLFGAFIYISEGWISRFSAERIAYLKMVDNDLYFPLSEAGTCFLIEGREDLYDLSCTGKVMLWGDSFGAHLVHGLRQNFDDFGQYSASSCSPIFAGNGSRCDEIYNDSLRVFSEIDDLDTLILSGFWPTGIDRQGVENFRLALSNALEEAKLRSRRVVLLGQSPTFDVNISRLGFRMANARNDDEFRWRAQEQYDINRILAEVAEEADVMFISLYDIGCDGTECIVFQNGLPLHWDWGHMTGEGSVFYGNGIYGLMEPLLSEEIEADTYINSQD